MICEIAKTEITTKYYAVNNIQYRVKIPIICHDIIMAGFFSPLESTSKGTAVSR